MQNPYEPSQVDLLRPSDSVGTIQYDESPQQLRISWDNRKIPKDSGKFVFLILFEIIWGSATCYGTAAVITGDLPLMAVLLLVFGWLGTIMVPYVILQRFSSEWIEISFTSISWGRSGWIRDKSKTVLFENIEEIALGDGSDRGETESGCTLNIYEKRNRFGQSLRSIPAYWVSEKQIIKMFGRIRDFIQKNSINVIVKVYDSTRRDHPYYVLPDLEPEKDEKQETN